MAGAQSAGRQQETKHPCELAVRRLRSPLHGALVQAVVAAGDALRADVAAGRLFNSTDSSLMGFVYCTRPPSHPDALEDIQSWPFMPHSLFELSRRRTPATDDLTAPLQDADSDADSPRRMQLFEPVDTYFTIRDVLCLRTRISQATVAVLAMLRCDPSPKFSKSELDCRQKLRDPIMDLLRRAEALDSAIASDNLALSRLSPKELEVANLLVEGQTEPEVAVTLARSPHTIHAHVKSIYRKLNITSRQELLDLL